MYGTTVLHTWLPNMLTLMNKSFAVVNTATIASKMIIAAVN